MSMKELIAIVATALLWSGCSLDKSGTGVVAARGGTSGGARGGTSGTAGATGGGGTSGSWGTSGAAGTSGPAARAASGERAPVARAAMRARAEAGARAGAPARMAPPARPATRAAVAGAEPAVRGARAAAEPVERARAAPPEEAEPAARAGPATSHASIRVRWSSARKNYTGYVRCMAAAAPSSTGRMDGLPEPPATRERGSVRRARHDGRALCERRGLHGHASWILHDGAHQPPARLRLCLRLRPRFRLRRRPDLRVRRSDRHLPGRRVRNRRRLPRGEPVRERGPRLGRLRVQPASARLPMPNPGRHLPHQPRLRDPAAGLRLLIGRGNARLSRRPGALPLSAICLGQ